MTGGWHSLSQESCGWQAEERSQMRSDNSGSVRGNSRAERGAASKRRECGSAYEEPDWGVSECGGGMGGDTPVKQGEERPKDGFPEVDISEGFIPSACARGGKKIAAGQGYCRRCH